MYYLIQVFEYWAISESRRDFIMLKHKTLQTTIAIFTMGAIAVYCFIEKNPANELHLVNDEPPALF